MVACAGWGWLCSGVVSGVGIKTKKPGQLALLRLRLRGGYLLSHFRSTIGAVRLNFSVRNGKRWNPHTITT